MITSKAPSFASTRSISLACEVLTAAPLQQNRNNDNTGTYMTMLEPKWAQSSTILERVPATSRPKDMEWSLAVEADVDVKQILFNNAILHRR